MLLRSRAGESGFRTLTFVLSADQPAGPVSVVGNFNDWTPGAHLLVPGPEGWRAASITVPDDYIVVFRYLGEGGRWFDEPDADFVDAGGSVVREVKGAGARAGSRAGAGPRAGAGSAGEPDSGVRAPSGAPASAAPEAGVQWVHTSMTPAQRAVFTAAKKARKAAKKIEKARRRKRHKIEKLLEKAAHGEADRARAERARAEGGAEPGDAAPGDT